ncbi:MAG: UbiA family prenyltransferase [Vicingaceae bacterium]
MNKLKIFIIRSNFYVALCAASLVIQTGLLLEPEMNYLFEALVVFLSTGCIYNLHRMQKSGLVPWKKPDLIGFKKSLNPIMTLVFLIFLAPCFFFFERHHFAVFTIGGIFSIAYSFPIKVGSRWHNLRTIPFGKLPSIVFVWTLMSVVFPLGFESLGCMDYTLIVLLRIFFLLAITVPFDIRDMEADRIEGIKTIPILVGWRRSRSISLLFIALFSVVVIMAVQISVLSMTKGLALIFSAILTSFLISRTSPVSLPSHFTFSVEGLSLVQTLILITACYFFP